MQGLLKKMLTPAKMKRGREVTEFLEENKAKLQKVVEAIREDPQVLVEVSMALLGEEADVVGVGVELATNLCKAANSFMAVVGKVRPPPPARLCCNWPRRRECVLQGTRRKKTKRKIYFLILMRGETPEPPGKKALRGRNSYYDGV